MKSLHRWTAQALFGAFFIALLAVGPAVAQWQVPDHSVPVGRGAGTGFKNTAPGKAGQVLTSNGTTSDPTFQPGPVTSVTSYGAKGDGTTDDTTAILAAITAANLVGGTVYFPPTTGCYLISATLPLTQTGVGLSGDGQQSWICHALGYVGPVIKVGNASAGPDAAFVRYMRIGPIAGASSTATGIYIANAFNFDANFLKITAENVAIDVNNDASASSTYNVYLRHIYAQVCTAGCIQVGAGGTINKQPQGLFIFDSEISDSATGSGILLISIRGVTITNTELRTNAHGFASFPNVGQEVSAVILDNVIVDASSGGGIQIFSNGGDVADWTFVNSGAGTSGFNGSIIASGSPGIHIAPATGRIQSINFVGGQTVNNGGHGVQIDGGSYINFTGFHSGANSTFTPNTFDGIAIGNAASHVNITGGGLGLDGVLPSVQQRYGVTCGTATFVSISNVELSGNTTGPINCGSVGANSSINSNLGVNPFNIAIGGSLNFAGANAVTVTSTGTTNSTLPSGTHTLAAPDVAQTWSANQSFNSGTFRLNGSSSGTTVVQPPAVASGTVTVPAVTDTLMGKATTDTLTNKTFDTAGTGNSFSINGLAATANTGTGSVVRATSPTLVTPVLGAATGTSLQLSGLTASSAVATDASKNLVSVTNTGTGSNVLATSPALVTPDIGAATGTSLNGAVINNTAWASYTPTVSCGAGTITTSTVSAAFKNIGKTTFVRISLNISNVGSCTGNIQFTLPSTNAVGSTALSGGNGTTGALFAVIVAGSQLLMGGITPANNVYNASGVYEAS